MEDDAPAVGVGGNEKVDISSTLSSSSASSSTSTRSRPTWGKVMRQTWARTSSRRLNSKSSTAPATAAGGPGGLSKSAPEKDHENEDKKRLKAKKERTKKTRIRIDKAAEERRALTSDFSSSSSSSSASPSPSYISPSSSSCSRYGTFAQSASATLTAAGSTRGPRGRFGYESLRAARIAPPAASGPWDEVSWVIDEQRPRKVSGPEIVRKEEPSGKQRTTAGAVAGKDRDGVARRDRVAGGKEEKAKAKAESVEEEEREEAEPEAVEEDAAEEKGAFDLLRAYYPHSLASLTSLTTKKGKEKSESESESDDESESDRDKIVKAKGAGGEETKNVTIVSEDDNEREGGKEKKNEAGNGKRPRRRAVSAKRNDEGRLLRLRAKLCKSGDILLCMRRERSYDDDGDDYRSGGGGASTPESSPELQGRDGRGRRADVEGKAQADAAAPEAKAKPSTPGREEESEVERAMEREMEELWKRANKPRRCSEPFAFPSRRSRGKGRRADADEATGGDGGSGSRDRSNTISSFVLAFEERKDLSQLARERDQEKSERKSRWRAYSFITPRRNRNGSNAQPAALETPPSSSSSASALPQDSPAAAGVVQGRQRSSSMGAPRPNLNLIEQPLRQARSLSDDEGESGRLDDDDDIYGGGAANTFVDLDNRPRPHQQLLLHQQQLKAQRDRRRREREAAEHKEDERPHETTRDNGNGNGSGIAKPSWRNLKLLFSSER